MHFPTLSLSVLLDPPANITVVRTKQQGQLNVTWLPPAVKYIDDSMMYEVRYVREGSPMRKVGRNWSSFEHFTMVRNDSKKLLEVLLAVVLH